MLSKFTNWLRERREAGYRRDHAEGRRWCGACCPQFIGGGPGLSVRNRDVMFYCTYDLPELAGRPKRYDIIGHLNSGHQTRPEHE